MLQVCSRICRPVFSIRICPNASCSSKSVSEGDKAILESEKKALKISFDRGLPVLAVPLPSRNELCQFTLRPISDNVFAFCKNLQLEDKGIDFVAVYDRDGIRISNSTPIEHLLQLETFSIRINDVYYNVSVPSILNDLEDIDRISTKERLTALDDIKMKVAALYAALQIDEFKLSREKLLITRLEEVELRLKPLDEIRQSIEQECERKASLVAWGIFVAMGIQTGVFFRLTYFEYSWDVTEPLSYFATYSTGLAALAYYLVTRQSFDYPAASERVFSKEFYKRAAKRNFNIDEYSQLVKLRDSLKHDLERLRDPLFQHLPASRLASLESELAKLHFSSDIPKHHR